jgi:long-subunit acyl-CoA synthetase (AMP-forming)
VACIDAGERHPFRSAAGQVMGRGGTPAPVVTGREKRTSSSPKPLVEQFLDRAAQDPRRVVIRNRMSDLWYDVTAADVAAAIERMVRALLASGVAERNYVALLGAASTEWLVAELACQRIGALTLVVGDDPDDEQVPGEVASRVRAVAVLDADSRARARRLRRIDEVSWLRSLPRLQVAHIVDIHRVDVEGADVEEPEPLAIETEPTGTRGWLVVRTNPEQGRPVYVEVGHGKHGAFWSELAEQLEISHDDRITPATPIEFWPGRLLMLGMFGSAGATFYFTSEGLADGTTRREVRPTIWWGTPRSWLTFTARVRAQVLASGRLSRLAYGRSTGTRQSRPFVLRSARRLVVMKPLLAQLGLQSTRAGLVLGGRPSGSVIRELEHWGLRMLEVECNIDPSGASTLKVHAPANAPEGGAEVIELQDVPSRVEARVRDSEYVSDVVAVQNSSGVVDLWIEPQLDSLSSWARLKGISFSSVTGLLDDEAVHVLLAGEASRLLATSDRTVDIQSIHIMADFSGLESGGCHLYDDADNLRTQVVRALIDSQSSAKPAP